MNKKKYQKLIRNFSFTVAKNFDPFDFLDDGQIVVNAIPTIVKYVGEESEYKNALFDMLTCCNRDIKSLKFKIKHGDKFTVLDSAPKLAIVLGIKRGLVLMNDKRTNI